MTIQAIASLTWSSLPLLPFEQTGRQVPFAYVGQDRHDTLALSQPRRHLKRRETRRPTVAAMKTSRLKREVVRAVFAQKRPPYVPWHYQFTVEAVDPAEVSLWTRRLVEHLRELPQLADVASDQQDQGLQAYVEINRDAASRLGINAAAVDGSNTAPASIFAAPS